MPDNVDKALNMAIVTTTAEKEEKAIGRDDRGSSTKVFAVGGSRESIPENRYENSYDRPLFACNYMLSNLGCNCRIPLPSLVPITLVSPSDPTFPSLGSFHYN
jgi:hypothetical protein